jgi:peptidoglycan/xylan/chitin deacetylase (PgdA/CDA1 family)
MRIETLSTQAFERSGKIRSTSTTPASASDGVRMALSPRTAYIPAPSGLSTRSVRSDCQNDAFSFWKLPEEYFEALEPSIEPSALLAELFHSESYLGNRERRTPRALRAYYHVKRMIPNGLRHCLNAAAIRARTPREFPRWPCESALLELRNDWLKDAFETLGIADSWHLGFWPHGHTSCIVLTHDVESRMGFDQMAAMADLEERYGFRSAWNLPLAQYKIDWNRVTAMRARGFEFGAHGLSHDGRLFRSERDFMELLPRLEQLAGEHDLRGFRAPSTLRDPQLIARMSFDFDSSFADTEPYEPQPGGTCSLFPFYLSKLIELPYTTPQDHTMLHLLHRNPVPLWVLKAKWIASRGGMILTLTHPDYCGRQPQLGLYEELLKHLSDIESAWRTLPSQAAKWWRDRARSHLRLDQGRPIISGPAGTRLVAQRLSEANLVLA